MPERETPGTSASACAKPMSDSVLQSLRSPMARSCDERSAHQKSSRAPSARRIAICHGSPRLSAIKFSPASPTTPAGIVATTTNQAIRSSDVSSGGVRSDVAERGDEPEDVVPEVGAHGDERPEMERDVERLVEAIVLLEVRPVAEPGHEDEVSGRGDRQELREPLDDAEDERLAVRDGVGILAHAREREDEGKPERRRRGAIDDRAAHAEILRRVRGRGLGEKRRKMQQSGERRP